MRLLGRKCAAGNNSWADGFVGAFLDLVWFVVVIGGGFGFRLVRYLGVVLVASM